MKTSAISTNGKTKVNQTVSTETVDKRVKPPDEGLRKVEVSQKIQENNIPSKDGNIEEKDNQLQEPENVKDRDARVDSSSIAKVEGGAVSPQSDLIVNTGEQQVIVSELDNHAGTEPTSHAHQAADSVENDETNAPLKVRISDQLWENDLEVAKTPSASKTVEPISEVTKVDKERRASYKEPPYVQTNDKPAPSSQAEEKDFEVAKQPSISKAIKPADELTKVDKERRASYEESPTVKTKDKSSSQDEEKDRDLGK